MCTGGLIKGPGSHESYGYDGTPFTGLIRLRHGMSAQHKKTVDSEPYTHSSSSSMHLPIGKQVQVASLPRESVFVTVEKS